MRKSNVSSGSAFDDRKICAGVAPSISYQLGCEKSFENSVS